MNEEVGTAKGESRASSQADAFLESEGDRWFERNRPTIHSAVGLPVDISFLADSLGPHRESINSILEIGCSDGVKLRQLCDAFRARGWGVDPSSKATECGNQAHTDKTVELMVGVAHELPFASTSFDLVYFGFCLYLVDRERLEDSLQEAHRVLKPGGFLAITDFDPATPHSRPYHHRAGITSHKRDYAAAMVAPGAYQLIHKKSFSHRQPFFDVESNERISVSVLYKEIENTGHTPLSL